MNISVCMACYNGDRFIKAQIESILLQLDENSELVISDDHSTDNTLSIIESINDNRIKLVFNSNMRGYTKNFENCLQYCNGDIIFLSDQDDVWCNNKVSIFLDALKDCDFVVGDCSLVDENLSLIAKSHFDLRNVKKGFFFNFLFTRYVGACMAFKKDVLIKCLPFPNNPNLCAHDYWICLVAELYFSTKIVRSTTMLYRRHSSNASNGGYKSRNSLYHKMFVRLYTFCQLLLVYFRK